MYKSPHDPQTLCPVASSKVIPMVQIMEKLVQVTPFVKALLSWDFFMISAVKLSIKTTKHPPNRQIVFMVAIEARRVKDHRSTSTLGHVATPKVPMEKRREDFQIIEKCGQFWFYLGPELVKFFISLPGNLFRQLKEETIKIKINK